MHLSLYLAFDLFGKHRQMFGKLQLVVCDKFHLVAATRQAKAYRTSINDRHQPARNPNYPESPADLESSDRG